VRKKLIDLSKKRKSLINSNQYLIRNSKEFEGINNNINDIKINSNITNVLTETKIKKEAESIPLNIND